jgi:hypothetical protein
VCEQAPPDFAGRNGEERAWLESAGYSVLEAGMNLLALHKADSCLAHVQMASAA